MPPVPGIHIPDAVIARLEGAKSQAAEGEAFVSSWSSRYARSRAWLGCM